LYVNKASEHSGYGRRLMAFVENLAREKGLGSLFALSTQAFVYLQQKGGFREAPPDILPPSRREKYEESGRHSRVLIKPVSTSVLTVEPTATNGT
jgi:amino-acid N-acetyltransferase